MANTANLGDGALDLDNIRTTLCRCTLTSNPEAYQPDSPLLSEFARHKLRTSGSNGCYADHFLYRTECFAAESGRYLHPTEHSFFAPLPDPFEGVTMMDFQNASPAVQVLSPHKVNINLKILDKYRTRIVPEICAEGSDGNLGSVSTTDIQVLQTIATRIYYGLFVAESKLRSERERFNKLITDRDEEGIMAAITKPEVERRNIRRVVKKCQMFSQEVTAPMTPRVRYNNVGSWEPSQGDSAAPAYKVTPEFVGRVFEKFIMPLTKEVEVDYLLNYVPIVNEP